MDAISSVSPETLKQCQLNPLYSLEKGILIYSQGQQANEFYFIEQGLIGLYHMLPNGKESLVRIYRNGEYFGFRTLFGDHFYHCSAKVLQTAKIIRIVPQNLPVFLADNPELTSFLIKKLASELQYAEHRLSQISYQRTQERVADSITYLTRHYPDYPWTYREIAEFSGCETETAIRISRELKKQGKLEADSRRLKIKD